MRGLRRDQVRLLVLDRCRGAIEHTRFDQIGDYLLPGDLLVMNTSRVLPAALPARRRDGSRMQLRPCVRRPGAWDVLAVEPEPPHRNVILDAGELLEIGGRLFGRVIGRRPDIPLLWRIQVVDDNLDPFLLFGEPIRYSYVPEPVAIDYYHSVYSTQPGSAEPASAGRPFTWSLINRLRAQGVGVSEIILHTGLSSYQDDDFDREHRLFEERFEVGAETAEALRNAQRVVAVGTTVVRALESAVAPDGVVRPMRGWTDLAIRPGSQLRAVEALVTGLHEPLASHFDMLEAFAGRGLLARAYKEAVERRYLWHEFGDSMLIV
jgi:S-adenosylmethionine:tRNA ribosyltransferase-isomerase